MADKTLEEIVEFVASIGNPDKIAEYMREQGIKGRKMRSDSCVMARYIDKEFNHDLQFVCAFPMTGFSIQRNGSDTMEETWDNPHNLADFMSEFDGGRYPELVEEGSEP